MRRISYLAVASALVISMAGCSGNAKPSESAASSGSQGEKVLNIYSSRHYDVDKKLYQMFEEKTGIKVNTTEGKGGELVKRVLDESANPQGDLFLTVGAESIYQLAEKQALGDSTSKTIEAAIPENYRGANWMGVSSRARVIAYAKDRVDPKTITSYEDLTKPEYQGKVLVRSSSSDYNKGLLASFIALNGKEKAETWAKGIVANLARQPKGNDRDQAKAVAAGEGDLAIMNSYYYVRMLKSSDAAEKAAAEKIGLIFPKDVHLNISYGAVLNKAKHKENAIKFLEFLASQEAQKLIAEENGEFPLNKSVAYPEIQKSWGEFSTQKLDFSSFGKEISEATKIFDQVGWK